jgi:hypothetical protein
MSGKGRSENLRPPWKPGQSGNPSGRPRKRPISDRYAAFAEMPLSEKQCRELGFAPGTTYGDAVTKNLYDSAINGKCAAAREIREGIEGRAAERREATAPEIINLHVVCDKAPTKRREDAENDSSPPTSPETID